MFQAKVEAVGIETASEPLDTDDLSPVPPLPPRDHRHVDIMPDAGLIRSIGETPARGEITTKIGRVLPLGELLDALEINRAGA